MTIYQVITPDGRKILVSAENTREAMRKLYRANIRTTGELEEMTVRVDNARKGVR